MDDEIPYPYPAKLQAIGDTSCSAQYVIYLPFSAGMGFHGTPEGLSRSNRFEIRLRASLPSFRYSGLSNAPPPWKQLRKSSSTKEFLNSFSRTVCARRSRDIYIHVTFRLILHRIFGQLLSPPLLPFTSPFLSNCCPCAKGERPSGYWTVWRVITIRICLFVVLAFGKSCFVRKKKRFYILITVLINVKSVLNVFF